MSPYLSACKETPWAWFSIAHILFFTSFISLGKMSEATRSFYTKGSAHILILRTAPWGGGGALSNFCSNFDANVIIEYKTMTLYHLYNVLTYSVFILTYFNCIWLNQNENWIFIFFNKRFNTWLKRQTKNLCKTWSLIEVIFSSAVSESEYESKTDWTLFEDKGLYSTEMF